MFTFRAHQSDAHRAHYSIDQTSLLPMSAAILLCLDDEQRLNIASAQIPKIYGSPESLEVLHQIVPLLNADQLNLIYLDLSNFTTAALTSGNEAWSRHAISFIQSVPSLLEHILDQIVSLLENEIAHKFNFIQPVESYTGEATTAPSHDDVDFVQLCHLFSFLTILFTTESLKDMDALTKIDRKLSIFLGHKDDAIASGCSQLIRWRVDLMSRQCVKDMATCKYYWDLIWAIKRAALIRIHVSNASIMWLRLLSASASDLASNSYFQENVINQEFYWRYLQTGLASSSHEQRKFCLSILQLSIRLINCSFVTDIFAWNTSNTKILLREWQRYTTIYEIVGVDTSLHQLQASTNDILFMMSPESLIHASWGFCLLSTGFQASMDSVRKAAALILLQLDSENLNALKYGLPFFEKQFLPYMMLSRHFNVRRVQPSSNALQCQYGRKFSVFLSLVIKSMDNERDAVDFARSTLRVLISSKESFDAVKIYTTWGIVKGLNGLKILEFGVDDSFLVELFDNPTEGELYSKVVQTLNLKLVLAFKPLSLADFIDLMSKYVNHNGYKILRSNLRHIESYVEQGGFTLENFGELANSLSSPEQAVLFTNLCFAETSTIQSYADMFYKTFGDAYITKLFESGCEILPSQRSLELVLQSALLNDYSIGNIKALTNGLKNLLTPTKLFLEQYWNALQTTLNQPTPQSVVDLFPRLEFLNTLLDSQELVISVKEAVAALSRSVPSSSEFAQSIDGYYKLRKSIIGELHVLVNHSIPNEPLENDEIQTIMSSIDAESTHSVTCQAVCNIAEKLFRQSSFTESNVTSLIADLLSAVVDMDENRFKLEDRQLHHSLIAVFFNLRVLLQAEVDSYLNELLEQFSDVIVKNAFARRGLLPKMMDCLMEYKRSNSASFERLAFLPKLLLESIMLRQLENSVFCIEGIIGTLYDTEIAPETKSNLYFEAYGVPEVAYKARLYAILNSIETEAFAVKLMDICIGDESSLVSTSDVRFNDGNEEFVRCQIAKTIVAVMDVIDATKFTTHYLPKLFQLVESDPSPLVRSYLEWAIAYNLLHSPEHLQSTFESLSSLLENHELKPVIVTIYERILFLAVQSMDQEKEAIYLSKLINMVVPAAATNKAVTRHFSMSLAISIYEEIERKNLAINPELVAIVYTMYSSAIGTSAFSQFRSGAACLWDVLKDLDLVHISGGLLVELSNREVEHVTRLEFLEYLSEEDLKRLRHPVGEPRKDTWSSVASGVVGPALDEQGQKKLSPLQTKSGAWSTVMDVDKKTEISDIVRSDLIVVASLVDKPPNLGGICRLCDVLGAGLITLHDMKVKEHPQFKNVAVTADHWMPMAEVKPELLVSFLRLKKADGYTLMGLEQTDKSVVLNSELKFPKKTLILLGREKEGIPGELLAELDLCVEIKQVGVIRSMNIQTAAAVIVHAYSSQNC